MSDLLDVQGLTAGYGEAIVLTDVTFKMAEGQALALLGRNGMGKTTLVNSIIGVTRHIGGTINLDGRNITGMRPDQRAHAGIGWVPQERNIFRSLTVEENMTAVAQPGPWTLAKVYGLFPRLAERRRNLGNQLSGGEQQMLAIGRALILNPRIILLDEPLEGLAPILIAELLTALQKIIREEGLSAILVEQNAQKILGVTDQAIIIERGSIVHQGSSAALKADRAMLETYVGVTDASSVSRKAQRDARRTAPGGRPRLIWANHGGPERSRTSDLRFRKPLLYPAELRDRPARFSTSLHMAHGVHFMRGRPLPH